MIKRRKSKSLAEAQDIRNSVATVGDEQCRAVFSFRKTSIRLTFRISGKMRKPWHRN